MKSSVIKTAGKIGHAVAGRRMALDYREYLRDTAKHKRKADVAKLLAPIEPLRFICIGLNSAPRAETNRSSGVSRRVFKGLNTVNIR